MNRSEKAFDYFGNGFNCSQAVVGAFLDKMEIDEETALQLATSFGGGIRRGEMCGAVTGALMALGLIEGHGVRGDMDTKKKAYAKTMEFQKEFEALNGTLTCKELLGHDISTPEGAAKISEEDLHNKVCRKLIEDAILILEKKLESTDK